MADRVGHDNPDGSGPTAAGTARPTREGVRLKMDPTIEQRRGKPSRYNSG